MSNLKSQMGSINNILLASPLLLASLLSGCSALSNSAKTATLDPKTTTETVTNMPSSTADTLDTDGDGVIDSIDACPSTAMNVVVDKHGCPIDTCLHCDDPNPYLERIFYPTAQSQLPDQYFASIEALVKQYRDIASYSKFKDKQMVFHIESHTAKNEVANELALSTARAEAIKQVLIERYGIDPSLIRLDINTSERPFAPNDTAEGRAMNQRVYLGFSLDPKE